MVRTFQCGVHVVQQVVQLKKKSCIELLGNVTVSRVNVFIDTLKNASY